MQGILVSNNNKDNNHENSSKNALCKTNHMNRKLIVKYNSNVSSKNSLSVLENILYFKTF